MDVTEHNVIEVGLRSEKVGTDDTKVMYIDVKTEEGNRMTIKLFSRGGPIQIVLKESA